MRSNTVTLWMIRCCSIGLATCLLAACSTSQYAPVQDLGYSSIKSSVGSSVKNTPVSYQVRPGDTMFAIAWRFGWDYKKLAKMNGIGSPYTIYVGQVVYFNETNSTNAIDVSVTKESVKKPVVTAKKPTYKAPSTASNSTPKSSDGKDYKGPLSIQWAWPLKGKLIQGFSSKGSAFHGIDLSSTFGKSVKAASSGLIVYAGSGIQGYGKLVVVKHNDTYLSAYAYNSRILVAEGTMVNAGQVIAEVGKGPQLDPRLHFEIRKDGKPVNPIRYLPKL